MGELAELQAQHAAGHGPCGCLQPDRCASARYLAVIERQQGKIAEWQAISEEQAETQRQSNVDLAAAAADLDRLERDKDKLTTWMQKMAEGEHLSYAPHREYPFAKCPFVLCRENRAALRAGKARR